MFFVYFHVIGVPPQDMDLYDESRALIYTGPVSRRTRSDTGWSGWTEYSAALLDNNCKSLYLVGDLQGLITLDSHLDTRGEAIEWDRETISHV